MVVKNKRLKVGDILEIKIGSQYGYILYLGKHESYGDCVLVKPGTTKRVSNSKDIDFGASSYVTFYPAVRANTLGLATPIGTCTDVPQVPLVFRRGMSLDPTRKSIPWIIEKGNKETLKKSLSLKERKIPIVFIWTHEGMVKAIRESWNPINEY